MLYFIPAWYQNNLWCENEQSWYERRMHTEFDDTVKQIQMFHRSEAYAYKILLLSFAPNFRHFLHRQSVYHAPYWSCFDAMQEIHRKKTIVLSIHDMEWPEDIEFRHTPFAIVAMLDGRKYAQIEFGEDGNPIRIDLYENEHIAKRNIYDDRGFISSTIMYQDGKPAYQDYLMENGTWKLRAFFSDGHVEINPEYPEYLLIYPDLESRRTYQSRSYAHMGLIIREVFSAYLERFAEADVFCAAVHKQHIHMLAEVLRGRKLILSFFEDRCVPAGRSREIVEVLEYASYIITDSVKNTERVCQVLGRKMENIMDITPYDSRVDFGISQQLNVQKILVPVDGLPEETMIKTIVLLGSYLLKNENAQVHLFTRKAAYDRVTRMLEYTRGCLAKAGLEPDWALEAQDTHAENDLESTDRSPVRFFVEQCVDELTVSKCMREQRVLVELRDNPELYLQITAISMGIPQIVHTGTQYVEHRANGIVLDDLESLPRALAYYLDGLANWNKAMIASYELGKKFTTSVLIDKWREVLEFVG